MRLLLSVIYIYKIMPVNKNALTRYALLDKLLSNRRKAYSIQDMTDYLEEELPKYGQSPVTKRQVEKDLNYLEFDSPFDVEFERFKVDAPNKSGDGVYKKPCIRYLDPSFSIFKKELSDEERSLLSSVLSTLGSFKGIPNFEWLEAMAHKFNLDDQQTILSMSKNISENSTMLAELYSAINAKAAITLSYHKFSDSEIRVVDVSPYMLKEYNRRWYLLCSPFDSNQILTFALDRIDKIEYAQGLAYKPSPEDFLERYEDIIGVTYYEDNALERITFWVAASSKDYMTTKPIHDSMRKIKGKETEQLARKYPNLPAGGEFFSIDCKENYELIRELTSFGANLIVLSPQHIVQKVVKVAKEMVDLYGVTSVSDEEDSE